MKPIAWYSRLAIWITALLLFVEAVSGRSFGVLTALSVCVMAAAFLTFAGALGTEHLWTRAISSPSDVTRSSHPHLASDIVASVYTPHVPVEDDAHLEAPSVTAPVTPSFPPAPMALDDPGSYDSSSTAHEVTREADDSSLDIGATVKRSRRVTVSTVGAADTSVSSACPRCQQSLREHQVSATCPECGASHHVSCWIENRFHCAREGCAGHGSLEEPGS